MGMSMAADRGENEGKGTFVEGGAKGRGGEGDVPRVIETLNRRKDGCIFCLSFLSSLLPCLGRIGGESQRPAPTERDLERGGGREGGRGGGRGRGGKDVVDHGDLE